MLEAGEDDDRKKVVEVLVVREIDESVEDRKLEF